MIVDEAHTCTRDIDARGSRHQRHELLRDLAKSPNAKSVLMGGGAGGKDGQVLTSGGRVLCVTALADSVRLAQQRAYDVVRGIHFDGAQWRNDIGHRAVKG